MERHSDGRVTRLALEGELDLFTATQLRAELAQLEDGLSQLVLDLRRLSFIDSTGVTAVLWAFRRAAENGYRLLIEAGDGVARHRLRMLGLERALPIAA